MTANPQSKTHATIYKVQYWEELWTLECKEFVALITEKFYIYEKMLRVPLSEEIRGTKSIQKLCHWFVKISSWVELLSRNLQVFTYM